MTDPHHHNETNKTESHEHIRVTIHTVVVDPSDPNNNQEETKLTGIPLSSPLVDSVEVFEYDAKNVVTKEMENDNGVDDKGNREDEDDDVGSVTSSTSSSSSDVDVFFEHFLPKESSEEEVEDLNVHHHHHHSHRPIRILTSNNISAIADYIRSNAVKNIIVMTGAGISTSAGIPDFRSPGTGLYANLAKYNLPYPEAVFDIHYFRQHPQPFYMLARELFPGRYKPTLCHYFIRLLAEKGLLLRNYTQNIDTLERVAGIQDQYLVEAHGSFHAAHCVGGGVSTIHGTVPTSSESEDSQPQPQPPTSSSGCGKSFPTSWVRSQLLSHRIPICDECNGLVKPDITFFGESLPSSFFECLQSGDFQKCDLLLVMGTSLQVQPFCSLMHYVTHSTPRLLINRERVGTISLDPSSRVLGFDFDGVRSKYVRDAEFLGACDDGVLALCKEMGCERELLDLFERGHAELEAEWAVEKAMMMGDGVKRDEIVVRQEIVEERVLTLTESRTTLDEEEDKEEEDEEINNLAKEFAQKSTI